jgi:hypothetical protein
MNEIELLKEAMKQGAEIKLGRKKIVLGYSGYEIWESKSSSSCYNLLVTEDDLLIAMNWLTTGEIQ